MNDHLYGPLNNAGTLWKKQLDAHLIGVRNDARMLEEILASSILEHEESGKEQTFRLHVFPDGSQLSSWFDGSYLVLHLGDAVSDELL